MKVSKKKKKKRVLKVKNLVIVLIVIAFVIGLFYYAITMPIKNIYIRGNKIISDDEILQISFLNEYPSFLLTKKKEIQTSLKKNPYIKDVKVSKKIGNRIEIEIEEYQVIALTKEEKIILSNAKELDNIYELCDVPILINEIENKKIYQNFAGKFGQIDIDILRQISEIEYSPVSVDDERFLLYMNDGNLVYITLTKMNKLNKYDRIKDQLNGQQGIIYLDSGDYVELKRDTVSPDDIQ